MATSGVSGVKGQVGTQATNHDAYADLDMSTFIQLLVTEMQSQDPMDPMDNQQILNQISQIRSIESNTRLTSTLDAVLLGQNMATASSLIGQTIAGLTDGGDKVTGKVDSVSVADGDATLHVGNATVSLKNISQILPTT